jgi:hypothetical protein
MKQGFGDHADRKKRIAEPQNIEPQKAEVDARDPAVVP